MPIKLKRWHEMFCAIWYHLYNFKNVKNIQGGALLLVKVQTSAYNFTKSNNPKWLFFTFFNCKNGSKSHDASQWQCFLPMWRKQLFPFNHEAKPWTHKKNTYKNNFLPIVQIIPIPLTTCDGWSISIFDKKSGRVVAGE